MVNNLDRLHQGNLTPAVSYLKITLIFTGIALVTITVIAGILFYRDSQPTEKTTKDIEVASSHIPESYFPSFQRAELNERKTLPDENKEESVTVVQAVQQYGTAVSNQPEEKTQPEQSLVTAGQNDARQGQNDPKLTAEEAFTKQKIDLAKQLLEQRRALLLSRRGKPSKGWQEVSTIQSVEKQDKAPELPSDKDFSAQGIGKDESTFPVDLTRVVTADRYIPCILIDQINSQLEGRVTCTAETNVYGYHGRKILIPAGTKFMGSHGTLKKVGDERFNITWERLLRPDGAHVKLTDAFASDAIGSTGVEGVVDRRNWEKYGGALLTSTVSVLAQMSIPSEGTNISNSVFENFSTDLGRVTASMLNENINIKPFSIVPAGTRIHVTPVTDIWLKKEGKEYSFNAVNQEEKF